MKNERGKKYNFKNINPHIYHLDCSISVDPNPHLV